MATTIEILKRARSLLEEKGWTQEVEARDSLGRKVNPTSDSAVCFCTIGAIRRAAFELTGSAQIDAYGAPPTAVIRQVTAGPIVGCNDDPVTDVGHILMMFDFAVLIAEEGL